MQISKLRFPAATLNAVVQMIIPPPKYPINRLAPDTIVDPQADLSMVMVIERGQDKVEELDHRAAVDQLVMNGEDAYGFPPYPFLAASLSQWKGKDLHSTEREIISSALYGRSFVRIGSPSYGWWRMLVATLPNQGYPYEEPAPLSLVDLDEC